MTVNKTEKRLDKIQKLQKEQVKLNDKINKELEAIKDESKKEEKPELEVGKWYKINKKDNNNVLIYYKGKSRNYGFDMGGDWSIVLGDADKEYYTPSTDSEISSALIKEAKKRGFKEGMDRMPKCLKDGHKWDTNDKFHYNISGDNKSRLDLGATCIFLDGKWAEIIEDKLELNGKEVIIDEKNDTITIGCVKDMDLDEWKTFVRILDYTGCKLSHSELGDIKVSDLKALLK